MPRTSLIFVSIKKTGWILCVAWLAACAPLPVAEQAFTPTTLPPTALPQPTQTLASSLTPAPTSSNIFTPEPTATAMPTPEVTATRVGTPEGFVWEVIINPDTGNPYPNLAAALSIKGSEKLNWNNTLLTFNVERAGFSTFYSVLTGNFNEQSIPLASINNETLYAVLSAESVVFDDIGNRQLGFTPLIFKYKNEFFTVRGGGISLNKTTIFSGIEISEVSIHNAIYDEDGNVLPNSIFAQLLTGSSLNRGALIQVSVVEDADIEKYIAKVKTRTPKIIKGFLDDFIEQHRSEYEEFLRSGKPIELTIDGAKISLLPGVGFSQIEDPTQMVNLP